MAKKYPIINENSCIACGTCVVNCKAGVFDRRRKPVVIKKENCIEGCKTCANVCPMKAITFFEE